MGSLADVGTERGLPRGRGSLPTAEVVHAQRERMLRAVIAVVAAKGYAKVTIGDVVERARVSRESFYAQFADKEECFLAAHEAGIAFLVPRVVQAAAAAGDAGPRDELRNGIRAYLRLIAEEPEFGRCMLIELQGIGPRGLQTRIDAHRRIVGVLRRWHAGVAAQTGWTTVSELRYAAAVGAVHDLVFALVAQERSADAPGLEHEATHAVAVLLEIPEPDGQVDLNMAIAPGVRA